MLGLFKSKKPNEIKTKKEDTNQTMKKQSSEIQKPHGPGNCCGGCGGDK